MISFLVVTQQAHDVEMTSYILRSCACWKEKVIWNFKIALFINTLLFLSSVKEIIFPMHY